MGTLYWSGLKITDFGSTEEKATTDCLVNGPGNGWRWGKGGTEGAISKRHLEFSGIRFSGH